MKKTLLLLIIIIPFILNSCAKIYLSPAAETRLKEHTVIAIIPPRVRIATKKLVDKAILRNQEIKEAKIIQEEMYNWLQKRRKENTLTVDIQDIKSTNDLLIEMGFFDDRKIPTDEICKKLGVEALLKSQYTVSKPMSDGAAIAMSLLFVGVSSNTAQVNLQLHDKETNNVIWNYNDEVSGGALVTYNRLIDALMRRASNRLPYSKQN